MVKGTCPYVHAFNSPLKGSPISNWIPYFASTSEDLNSAQTKLHVHAFNSPLKGSPISNWIPYFASTSEDLNSAQTKLHFHLVLQCPLQYIFPRGNENMRLTETPKNQMAQKEYSDTLSRNSVPEIYGYSWCATK
ncbi:uncharacterized protein ZBAI_08164 [Zygosaccharomyces bailii ISA1307]|nr:uncharacterized protein ZBAI_08164 [Zygosaccharomyces bailii ISA1307]